MEIKREYSCTVALTKGEAIALQETCRETGLDITGVISGLIQEHLFDFQEKHKAK